MTSLEFRLLDRRPTADGELVVHALQIPPDLLYLQGHFPDNPLLPGTAQLLAIVLDRVHAMWPEMEAPRRVTRLKFKRTIGPGDLLELHLLRRSADDVRFTLLRGGETCTEGALVFA